MCRCMLFITTELQKRDSHYEQDDLLSQRELGLYLQHSTALGPRLVTALAWLVRNRNLSRLLPRMTSGTDMDFGGD